jgi:transcriptional regulator with XRE-family HTH domain
MARHVIDKSFSKKIGKIIKALREVKGISRKELSQHLGISCYQLSKYETAHNRVSIEMLFHISRYFKKSLDFFVKEVRKEYEKKDKSEESEEYVDLFAIEGVLNRIGSEIEEYIAEETKNEDGECDERKFKNHPVYVPLIKLEVIADCLGKYAKKYKKEEEEEEEK